MALVNTINMLKTEQKEAFAVGAFNIENMEMIQARKCIIKGICKINFATELRIAYTNEIYNILSKQTFVFDPRVYGSAAKNKVKNIVKEKMLILGSYEKANEKQV